MKCQILFSGKNKKNVNLLPVEFAHRVVKVNSIVSSFLHMGLFRLALVSCD